MDNPIENDFEKSYYLKYWQQYPRSLMYNNPVLDVLFCGVLGLNNEGLIIALNASAEKIIKKKKDNILGKYIEDLNCFKELSEVITLNNGLGRFKISLNEATVIANLHNLTENGKNIGTIVIFHKSGAPECINQELDVTANLLREINTILESSYDGMYITDEKGKVTRVNAAFERMFSLNRKNILDETVYNLIEKGVFEKSAVIKTLDSYQNETVMYEKNGRKILSTSTPVFNQNGKMNNVVVNVRDISELDSLRMELENQMKLSEKYSYQLRELQKNEQHFPDVIMHSKKMREVMYTVTKVAKVDSTILVTGESGVGKEVVVRHIHNLSSRSNGELIKISCGAIPPTLLESELFGYEPGAFTGAREKGKIGLFELAHKGTLFLDEIGEIDISTQVKLLRTLQEKEITRVGGTKSIKIDVRIITATNRNLRKMMEEGRFREDLFYRLNVINIDIPPLRERKEDIIPLLLYNIEKFNKKYHKNKSFVEKTIKILEEYSWPGNIRELENLVENLVVLAEADEILPVYLPENIIEKVQNDGKIVINEIISLRKAIEMVECQIISNAKNKYGSTRQVAKVLGVDQSTVVRKMQKYRITDDELHQS